MSSNDDADKRILEIVYFHFRRCLGSFHLEHFRIICAGYTHNLTIETMNIMQMFQRFSHLKTDHVLCLSYCYAEQAK